MHQCEFVVFDVSGIDADDLVEGRKKLLILSEWELYPVYEVGHIE